MPHKSIITDALAALVLLFACGHALAENTTAKPISQEELIGAWKLEYESPRLKVSKKRHKLKSYQSWNFRGDGTVESKASDERAKATFAVTPKYEIKDGKILIDEPGRPGKKIAYTVIEKTDKKMVLKGSYGYYFFTRQ